MIVETSLIDFSKESTLKSGEIKQDLEPYDWTYTTLYKGTIQLDKDKQEGVIITGVVTDLLQDFGKPVPSKDKLNVELLKRPDPILFFNELVLYEDELADNGTTQLSLKVVRMMSARLQLTLSRE